MFMMRNPIEDYAPATLSNVSLEPGEHQHFSFVVTEVEKHLIGYKPQSDRQYRCHFTSNRLIFEPVHHGNGQATSKMSILLSKPWETLSFYQLPYEKIESFKVMRSLNLSTVAKIVLKSVVDNPDHELMFMVTPIPQGRIKDPAANCSADFAELGKLMLQVDEGFMQHIQNSPVPVLVNFWAPGCKPCEMFTPVMNQISEQFGDQIKLLKVNMDDGPGLPIRYGVDSVPTVLIFKEGTVVDKIDGAIPATLFAKVLQRYL